MRAPTVAENAQTQRAELDSQADRSAKLVRVLDGVLDDTVTHGRCAVCVVLDDPIGSFPESETRRAHYTPISCRITVNGNLLTDVNSPFCNAFRPAFNRQKERGRCWKCYLVEKTPFHSTPSGSSECRFDDVAKPLLYALFYLEHWRTTILPAIDPTFSTTVFDFMSYASWLRKRTPGNLLTNFEEVLYRFGVERSYIEE